MLPRQNRLKNSSDFDKVYKSGKYAKGKYGRLGIYSRGDGLPSRFGVVVPSKFGKAAKRSRAKRQVREIFKQLLVLSPSGLDITYIVWDLGFDFSSLDKEMTVLFNKLMKQIDKEKK
ncbi:ribonuclease P protein component [Candidatus Dojkabacteria bacterium]|nr:ribonuclease P protein component [Candidatus Dojkabacteria bacterium]